MAIQPARHPDLEPATEPSFEVPEAVQPSGIGRSSLRGFLWTTLAWTGNRIAVLGLTLVLARLLTPEDFGIVTAALTLIAILDAALDLGVGAAVIAEQQVGLSRRIRTAFTLSLVIAAAIAAVGALASPLIADPVPRPVGRLRVRADLPLSACSAGPGRSTTPCSNVTSGSGLVRWSTLLAPSQESPCRSRWPSQSAER